MRKELSDLNSINNTLTLVDDYVWKIMDLKQIKNAHNGEYFESDIFNICEYIWRLRLYPNGIEKDQMGDSKLQLYLNELPNEYNIKSVSIEFQFKIKETETFYLNLAQFRDGNLCKGWRHSYLTTHK
eukprot:470314_1